MVDQGGRSRPSSCIGLLMGLMPAALERDDVFVELTAVSDSDNGVNADANWKRVITKKRECEAAVLAILKAPDSLLILLTTTHRVVWKTKKNATKLKSINKSIEDAKKDEEVIEVKKVAINLAGNVAVLDVVRSWF
jgi:hypothetical protein